MANVELITVLKRAGFTSGDIFTVITLYVIDINKVTKEALEFCIPFFKQRIAECHS